MRPGRFDRHVYVGLPDKKGRLDILNLHAAQRKLAANVDLDRIARQTSGLRCVQTLFVPFAPFFLCDGLLRAGAWRHGCQ